ncbi:MAG: DUF1343 domain-containing protein [Pleurocapsa minor GSE-CHR-MK-17-07R]|jgi:uncharacterized protein YbbC (DUF1343 family)|nr:DUF1343 domain-containing protein [Pleurocapsa minor GSE-CHR-MK 17-07R]
MSVLTGLEILRDNDFERLKGRRVGLLTNPSAVTRDLRSAYDLFRFAPNVDLKAIFSPEHGFAAAALDGAHVASSVDPRTGVPIHSLYGETLRPTPAMLEGLDVLVCDIQDIGVRYYTFAWTISYAIEAAGAAGLEVILLDRPNPLGDAVDGTPGAQAYLSIVGACPIPVQHGMTLGELMRLFNQRWNPTPAFLHVIACQGYARGMRWEETGMPFVPPSPAMPHLVTARHYPGACLVEGTNISEGRGTSLPFEVCGAPFIDAPALADHLNAQQLPGVRYRPHTFTPYANKYSGEVCHGVQAHITGPDYRPLLSWVGVIRALRHLYPDKFAWRPPYGKPPALPFDLLAGSGTLRAQIDANVPLETLAEGWAADAEAWRELRREALLYGDTP